MAKKSGGCCVVAVVVLMLLGGGALFFVREVAHGDPAGWITGWVNEIGASTLDIRVESLERDEQGRFAVALRFVPRDDWTCAAFTLRRVRLRSDAVGYVDARVLDPPPSSPGREPFTVHVLSDPMPDVDDLWADLDLHVVSKSGHTRHDMSWTWQQVLRGPHAHAGPRDDASGEPGPDAPPDAPKSTSGPDAGDDGGR
ncbi:MAG: hypothetical protein H6825_01885 [Planctomycetes bacterium]|nr:hypothetical protein [Planctomycetota bacterium]